MAAHLDANDLLACAIDAARAAGEHALKNEARRRETAQTFKHDIKLVLDTECQVKAEEIIHAHYPAHAILGEEGGSRDAGNQPTWIVDPIDGTVNFSHGLEYWCSSVAVEVEGQVVAGAVYAPALRALYTATISGDAHCNEKPIHVSDIRDPADALVLTGLEKTFDTHQGTFDVTRAVALRVRKVRLMGAAALDICHVADGKAEAFFESGIHIWDVAAGGLIVERAGDRRVEMLQKVDEQRRRYLITNGLVHDEMRGMIVAARSPAS